MRLLRESAARAGGASIAQVNFSENGNFGAVGAMELRGMKVFAPRGIAYRPCEGDRLALLDAGGTDICIGALSSAAVELLPGELRLCSAGGACIDLKNNGDIVLNGLRITKDGRLVEREAE